MLGAVTGFLGVVCAVAVYAFWRERKLRLAATPPAAAEKEPPHDESVVAGDIQSEKMEALALLAGGVAHDFNNIVSIIDGYARMALRLTDENSEAAQYLNRIHLAAGRGAALTKKLLTFGRHNIVSSKPVDAGKLVKEQEALLKPLLDPSFNLLVVAESGLYIECAPDAIGQIMMNLVINARDAMPGGGTIIVDACKVGPSALRVPVQPDHKERDFVRLGVTDAGTGIGDDIKSRIFDPFFTTKPQGKGTGLGLSLVYAIMRQAGGYLDFESKPGRGTSMWLYFPVSDKLPEAGDREEGNRQHRFEGVTALVAEDEADLLHVVCDVLEDMGMRVIPATNGKDALALQNEFKGRIDFLLTDVVMPEMDGAHLADAMHRVRPETRVLFMSGYPTHGGMARVRLPEDAHLLAKPIAYDRLAVLIEGILAKTPEQDEPPKGHDPALARWKTN